MNFDCAERNNVLKDLNNNTEKNKILLLQHNNSKAIILEQQIFEEAIEEGLLFCNSEIPLNKIKSILSRRKIQTFIGESTKKWILHGSVIEKYLKKCKDKGEQPIILFLNTIFTEIRYPVRALKYLKAKYNAVFCLYYIDVVSKGVSIYANYLRENGVFDVVYTFDKQDAQKYNLNYWQTPYSMLDLPISNSVDLYFTGVDTDRYEILNEILKQDNLNCRMDLISVTNTNLYNDCRVSVLPTNQVRSYKEVLKSTLKSNCILEIVRPGQSGFTLRAFEAVVYNKKLLTNNEAIKDFEFYNPQYMKVFKKVEDIDWNWVENKTCVNYHYDGSFSPVKFIKELKCLDERKK